MLWPTGAEVDVMDHPSMALIDRQTLMVLMQCWPVKRTRHSLLRLGSLWAMVPKQAWLVRLLSGCWGSMAGVGARPLLLLLLNLAPPYATTALEVCMQHDQFGAVQIDGVAHFLLSL